MNWDTYDFAKDTEVCTLLKEQAALLPERSRGKIKAKVITSKNVNVLVHDMFVVCGDIEVKLFSVEEDGEDVILIVEDSNYYVEKSDLVKEISEVIIQPGSFVNKTLHDLMRVA